MLKNYRRYLTDTVLTDLQKKMVFIGGPRQVGKTTFAKSLFTNTKHEHSVYLNWDRLQDRQTIIQEKFSFDAHKIIFNEIHKYKFWRRTIKGLYDTVGDSHQIIVTGSAKLDHFRKGGDSLLSRYHYYRLHPFTLHEFSAHP